MVNKGAILNFKLIIWRTHVLCLNLTFCYFGLCATAILNFELIIWRTCALFTIITLYDTRKNWLERQDSRLIIERFQVRILRLIRVVILNLTCYCKQSAILNLKLIIWRTCALFTIFECYTTLERIGRAVRFETHN